MTPPSPAWDEASLSEAPAIAQLERLGWTYVAPEVLDAERDSVKEAVLTARLAGALRRLNPWLSADNVSKAVRLVTGVQAASLMEASQALHTRLTHGASLEQDLGDGKQSHSVRFFDFDDARQNEFVVTRQLTLEGAKRRIRPDVLLYVNGIPLGILECKSPMLGDGWRREAIDQLARYEEQDERFHGLGAPRLFETMQVLVASCGQDAVYGTVLTPHRYFVQWKTPYPRTLEDMERELGRAPNAQEVLIEGMLRPAALLDLMQSFVVFERTERGIVRKLGRYQQVRAVNKAMERARAAVSPGERAASPGERGGVVWHTQGSGKSLTMLWLAVKLRRDPALGNPTLVILTDRKDLDEQIGKTFAACGVPNPERAETVRHLRELLSGPPGKTVLTTVQKFQELEPKGPSGSRRRTEPYPRLSEASNVFVLADEAHRTQYGGLAANLRQALPNACFFGFSGTPIDKNDRSTVQTFGPYIDTYTIEQAVADGATVPIRYEGRLAELRILGSNLDALFDRVFADRTDEEREAIKKKYARESAIAGAPKRIEAICLDLIEHFTTTIQPNGYKAQLVAVNRETAVLYHETLLRLHAPASAVVISSAHNDEARLAKHRISDARRKELIKQFRDPRDPLSILVVCDMLLTGFDAPVEQVMYLDAPLREHTLLQAIARVNRVHDDAKKYGLVVDYWGVSEALEEALAIFAPSDVRGAMTPKSDELPRLETRHAAAMRFFSRVKKKNDLEACIAALGEADVRAQFEEAFRRFADSLDMLLPDPRALPYAADARWLGKIRQAAAARFRDRAIDISDCGAKVRALIEEAVSAEGIQILVQEVELFSRDFEDKLKALKTDEARASEMEHALKNEIHVRFDEDPAFYTSLRERLEAIVSTRKAKRIEAAEQLELMIPVKSDAARRHEVAESLGLSPAGLAVYGLLGEGAQLTAAETTAQSEQRRELASMLEEQLAPQYGIVDWTAKEDVKREMRRIIKRALRVASVADEECEPLSKRIVELYAVHKGR